jgi:16S rRNA (cytidine1402-2'-O)-methyltransferase
MGKLYIVATPIGNLEDITLRALRILKEVDIIACEDTRRTLKLLNHYEIKNKLLSYHAYNEEKAGLKIIAYLQEDKSVALVSDGGTPGISDPGAAIVHKARDKGIEVVPLPGASAFTALLSASGFPVKGVFFEGFLYQKGNKRKKRLKELLEREAGSIVFESPYRICKLLTEISEIDSKRILVIGRELTKIYEEIITDTAQNLLTYYEKKKKIKGEFTIYISS